ncbi:hypothetical protein A3D00_01225 [Candidatus Woesebacteria bacterium RIFCSPHIGHO2_02_FULL_38_9]|uniref:EfeO-type cupredoxin-like domain-containing protein n=1 Tax=Candidatus Woesebacteria bacterium RIFCSPHIGHO2_01_FULL_39_28 TaxID=1802496 RepID=A0A1F7YJ96_9BACT|nr:MAG: hypothetical protein A2627_01170 [Candidatus Woesebacteria bacterium RIFCSPHIGHO2_01_FULL_39_28]OGM31744.1 MAG: hypothetical protein A3D00_01225 [Candidatus Woesebacteria bacterium RIFCSPHIGHO2_02_FULL_38_9]OGM57686.1 MAG: hypothetical protein A3A50_01600 [Candidatus Woesebacteria bacterium RIFCSPLOWO2_01_FULL_38_20]
MTLDKILVSISSVIGIAFTYWFFLLKNEKETIVSNSIDIVVLGGYSPQNIIIPKGKVTKINFIRKDPTTCLEEVILDDFHSKKYLPLNKTVTVELKPQETGEFAYHCGMNMYHGKIIVK